MYLRFGPLKAIPAQEFRKMLNGSVEVINNRDCRRIRILRQSLYLLKKEGCIHAMHMQDRLAGAARNGISSYIL